MKFYVGQPVWALFDQNDPEDREQVVEFGRFPAIIVGIGDRYKWKFWKRYDWAIRLIDCPNGDHWDFNECLLDPRNPPPDQFKAVAWDQCIWKPCSVPDARADVKQ